MLKNLFHIRSSQLLLTPRVQLGHLLVLEALKVKSCTWFLMVGTIAARGIIRLLGI